MVKAATGCPAGPSAPAAGPARSPRRRQAAGASQATTQQRRPATTSAPRTRASPAWRRGRSALDDAGGGPERPQPGPSGPQSALRGIGQPGHGVENPGLSRRADRSAPFGLHAPRPPPYQSCTSLRAQCDAANPAGTAPTPPRDSGALAATTPWRRRWPWRCRRRSARPSAGTAIARSSNACAVGSGATAGAHCLRAKRRADEQDGQPRLLRERAPRRGPAPRRSARQANARQRAAASCCVLFDCPQRM